jgi:hypothetical protein
MSLSQKDDSINRRQFIKASALAAGAAILNATKLIPPQEPEETYAVHLPIVSSNAESFSWFVDSQDGNDTNDGRTSLTPLRTLAELQRRGIKSNDRIYLRRGSHWREQLTISPGIDNVLVASYGEGEPPLLDCSDIQENGSFAAMEGYPNVYSKVLQVAYSPSEPSWMSVWEDGKRLVRAASLQECSTTPGSYFAIDENSPSCTVYIHASDSSAVDQNDHLYECSVRHAGVYGYYAQYTTLIGLRCRRNFCDGGSIKTGPYATLRDCIAEEGSKHNAYIRRGTNVFNCTFSKAYYVLGANLLVLNEDIPDGEDTLVENCLFEIDPEGANAHYIGAFNSHHNVSGYFGVITVTNGVFKNFRSAGIMLALNSAADLVINNPQFIECRCGISGPLSGNEKPGCRMVVNGGVWQSSVEYQRAVNVTLPMVPIVINDFTFKPSANCDAGYILITAASQVALIHCTLDISAAYGLRNGIYSNNSGSAITVYGTRFRGDLSNSVWYYLPAFQSLDSNFNTFEVTFRTLVLGTSYNTLPDHQAGTGEDLDSVFVP